MSRARCNRQNTPITVTKAVIRECGLFLYYTRSPLNKVGASVAHEKPDSVPEFKEVSGSYPIFFDYEYM